MTTKPTKRQLAAARDVLLPDVIAPGLAVMFVGINPSLYSAAVGHHFGRPGNRFWPALFASGFTPRLFKPCEDGELISLGCGLTNFVDRATARADELSKAEIIDGAAKLQQKLHRNQIAAVAYVGITAYRVAFADAKATVGRQDTRGDMLTWVLPNPSGLNAHYQAQDFAELFREFRLAAGVGT